MARTAAEQRDPRSGPPQFLQLAAHPVRWQLLSELADSDRTVRELTELVGRPQNLVSYHLRQLRSAGLVSSRRSTADRRDAYYAVDLDRCGDLLGAAGRALHPGLASAPMREDARAAAGSVLFLCTGNSSRSQIAEALLASMSGGALVAASAGSAPKAVHPNAVRVLAERGIDISDARAKHLDELAEVRFDVVVTLCDRVREVCPDWPDDTRRAPWSIPDPSLAGDDHDESYPAFERTADELERRIHFLIASIGN